MDLSSTKEPKKQGNNRQQQKPKEGGFNGQNLREQKPNYRLQQKKMFKQTLQQEKWFKKGAYIKCRR